MYIKHHLHVKFSIFYLFLFSLLMSCSHSDEPKEAESVVLSEYTLEAGEVLQAAPPLPNSVPIYVVWRNEGKVSHKELAFRGWDFDYDDRIDMLQELDREGKVVQSHFDFNFDGKIDWPTQSAD